MDLGRIAVVSESVYRIFDGLWQGGEAGQRNEGRQGNQCSSVVSSGWPRYIRIHRFEYAISAH